MLLSSISNGKIGSPFVLLQSSSAASSLPFLQAICAHDPEHTLLVCLLHPPSRLADAKSAQLRVVDLTDNVPGYCDPYVDPRERIAEAIQAAAPGPLTVIIDSLDTLLSDLSSLSQTSTFLSSLLSLLNHRPTPSRLIVHLNPSAAPPSTDTPALLRTLTHTRFSSSLAHLTAHPPVLLRHVAAAYGTPPPPRTAPERFWAVFSPIAGRGLGLEAEKLVFGPDGEGTGGAEIVFEVLTRGVDGGSGKRAGRGVERALEGWARGAPCALEALESLWPVFARKAFVEEKAADPTQSVSFNLALTAEQQTSRAQVPLPYAHEGKPVENASVPAAIYYDPDSADDIDDDDPDEDLDI